MAGGERGYWAHRGLPGLRGRPTEPCGELWGRGAEAAESGHGRFLAVLAAPEPAVQHAVHLTHLWRGMISHEVGVGDNWDCPTKKYSNAARPE